MVTHFLSLLYCTSLYLEMKWEFAKSLKYPRIGRVPMGTQWVDCGFRTKKTLYPYNSLLEQALIRLFYAFCTSYCSLKLLVRNLQVYSYYKLEINEQYEITAVKIWTKFYVNIETGKTQ